VGQRANGEFSDLGRHPDAQRVPGLVILRLDAPLYFFNANVARTQILEQAASDPPPQAILLDLGASADLDIGTADMLRVLCSDLRGNQIDLLFRRWSSVPIDTKTRLLGTLANRLYASMAAAVAALKCAVGRLRCWKKQDWKLIMGSYSETGFAKQVNVPLMLIRQGICKAKMDPKFFTKEMQHVTKIDVVNVDTVAGVVGLRKAHARTDSRADGASILAAHVGAHKSSADGGQCADDEHHGGCFLYGGQSQSN
jgi:hypothetical protein